MHIIKSIRSGGQTGADRAALDVAIEYGYTVFGWCPKDGWAEDHEADNGLLEKYPQLKEAPSSDPAQRTEYNVEGADVTIIFYGEDDDCSPGTQHTIDFAESIGKPYLVIGKQTPDEVYRWLVGFGEFVSINVAGPRESEKPGVYNAVSIFMKELLDLYQDDLDTINKYTGDVLTSI